MVELVPSFGGHLSVIKWPVLNGWTKLDVLIDVGRQGNKKCAHFPLHNPNKNV
jgi:hypothetical protein